MRRWEIATAEDMRRWGEALGRRIVDGGLIYLSGDLGAGKTTLAGGILTGHGFTGRSKSPTYTLVEPYETARGPVYHFDLYRLSDPEELDMLGFRDYLDARALCLIEWPERAAGALPAPDLHLQLDARADAHRVSLLHASARGADWL